MTVVFLRDVTSGGARPDNTLEAVAIPVASRNDLEQIRYARNAFPRAAVIAVAAAGLALDAVRAGAHAHVEEGASDKELEAAAALGRARRDVLNAAMAKRDEAMNALGHELRNPLNVVSMTVALLAEAHEMTADRRAAHLEKIERAVERMTTLLDDVADASRFDAGTVTLQLEPVAARELLTGACANAKSAAAGRGVTLTSSAPADLVLVLDRRRATRALTVVLENVIASARAGSQVRLEAQAEEDLVAFVARSAPPPPRTASATPTGRGVSLALAARIIAAHGGRAWTDADVAPGRPLSFRLPRTARLPHARG
jgi:signal transduction histidine kinase